MKNVFFGRQLKCVDFSIFFNCENKSVSLPCKNHNQAYIAEIIGKEKSVISRELKRNCDVRSGLYRHVSANKKYHQRQK